MTFLWGDNILRCGNALRCENLLRCENVLRWENVLICENVLRYYVTVYCDVKMYLPLRYGSDW